MKSMTQIVRDAPHVCNHAVNNNESCSDCKKKKRCEMFGAFLVYIQK